MSTKKTEITETGGETTRNFSEKAKTWAKVISYVAFILLLFAAGFFTGRKVVGKPGEPITVYIPGDTVYVDKTELVPVYIKTPPDTANIIAACVRDGKFSELFPHLVKDSIIYITKDDTSAVIADWATERFYEETLFDIDTVGTATVRAKTQYNRLAWMDATFVPVIKQVTTPTILTKKFSPFVGAGISTMPEVMVGGGVFFEDKYGVSAMYQYNWDVKRHAVGLMTMYKF